MLCHRCDDRGAVRVQYRSGEPFDIGICSCSCAALFRAWLERRPERLVEFFKVPAERIGLVEDLAGEDEIERPSSTTSRDVLVSAGKVDRAGLGGKVKK